MSIAPQYQITAEPDDAAAFFGVPYDFLRLEVGQEAETVSELLRTAVDLGEVHTNRVFRLTEFTGLFPCFLTDPSMSIRRPFVQIDMSPLIDVQAFRLFENETDPATVITPDVVRQPDYSRLFLPKDFDGTIDDERIYPIEVDFRAGYSTGSPTFPQLPVPTAVRTGLKQHVAYLFENRGDLKGDFADAVPDDVIRSYTRVRIPPGAA